MVVYRELYSVLIVFAFVIFLGYVMFNAHQHKENIGSSVVVNGDTLRIVEWTKLYDMYVLENGLVYRLKKK